MSQIAMTIIDPDRAIHGRPHASFADAVVAALSADPETLEELEAALARFSRPEERNQLAHWSSGARDEPYDAGISIVDLGARLVVLQSTYSLPGSTGEVLFRDSQSDREVWIPYHLSDDWLFRFEVEDREHLANQRRQQRLAAPPLDARRVLYGRLCEFIVAECFAARSDAPASAPWRPPEGWSLRALPERAKENESPTAGGAVAEIHARWLMSARDDLQDRSPRDLLLADTEHIDRDLQYRSHQWTFLQECPLGLSTESAAFRFAGFGTHENVLYYELVRDLIWECWDRVVEPDPDTAPTDPDKAGETRRLNRTFQERLHEPKADLHGRTPAQVIERERMRLPMAVSGEEAAVDDDCPLCQMMAEEMGPVFWHLDGCNMDDDFPFSFHRSREEWEKEQREWAEMDRQFQEKWQREQAEAAAGGAHGDEAESSSIWQSSMSATDPRRQPPSIVLFGIGGHLAELGEDLKASAETEPLVDSLNRQFVNLRAAIGDPAPALVEPVVARFCAELESVAEARPDLVPKCADLERQLNELAAHLSAEEAGEDDLPF